MTRRRTTRTSLYQVGHDARPLRSALYGEMLEDFARPRALHTVPELTRTTASEGLRAALGVLGVATPPPEGPPPRYAYRVVPMMRRIPDHVYGMASRAVQEATGLTAIEAQRRMDAAVAELYLAPAPSLLPRRGECPWAYWSWDGEWLRCQWAPRQHPEAGIHADSSVPAIGKWHQLDLRAVNLEYWAS